MNRSVHKLLSLLLAVLLVFSMTGLTALAEENSGEGSKPGTEKNVDHSSTSSEPNSLDEYVSSSEQESSSQSESSSEPANSSQVSSSSEYEQSNPETVLCPECKTTESDNEGKPIHKDGCSALTADVCPECGAVADADGKITHLNGCSLSDKNEALLDEVTAVIQLIDALPTAEEFQAQYDSLDTSAEDSVLAKADLVSAAVDAANEAQKAYEALSGEQQEMIPAEKLDKLTALTQALMKKLQRPAMLNSILAPELQMIGGKQFLFAKGVPITISAPSEGNSGAIVTWEGNDGEPIKLEDTATVFGGYHNDETQCNTKITMEGGTLHAIYGGGLHLSDVGTATIIVDGGTVKFLTGGGASSLTHDCGCGNAQPWYAGDPKDSPCKVRNVSITVNKGEITGSLYSGGEGISYTGTTDTVVNSGTIVFACAGGSNGLTEDAKITVNGGKITSELNGTNHGAVTKASIIVNGGTVKTLFAACDMDSNPAALGGGVIEVNGGVIETLDPGYINEGGDATKHMLPETAANLLDVSYDLSKATIGNLDQLAELFGGAAKTVIARIGDQNYFNLEGFIAAFNAISGEAEVRLESDIDLGTLKPDASGFDAGKQLLTVPAGAEVTFDLNGHTISAVLDTNINTYGSAYILSNLGSLHLKGNGTLEANAAYGCTATLRNQSADAVMVIEDVTIKSDGGNAVRNNGELTIKSGHFSTTGSFGSWDNGTSAIHNRGKLVIEGGTFTTVNQAPLWMGEGTIHSVASISGGTFNSQNSQIDIQIGDGTVEVKGGSFHVDPSDYVPAGYIANLQDGWYVVTAIPLSEGDITNFVQMKEMLAGASASNFVELTIVADIVVPENLEISNFARVTIAPGKTLSVGKDVVLTLNGALINNGTLDISTIGNGFVDRIMNISGEGTIKGLPSTSGGIYRISSAAQLQMMHFVMLQKADSNGVFTGKIALTSDVDLSGYHFLPLGYNSAAAFSGSFDGQGHAIKNLSINADYGDVGLFSVIDGFTMRDVSIVNASVTTQGAIMGTIAGESYGNCSFENVTVSGEYSNAASYYCGGWIGYMGGEGNRYEFINCHNAMDVTGHYNVGAFWGSSSGSTAAITMVDCSNSGEIKGTGTVHIIMGFAGDNTGKIYNFRNEGSLTETSSGTHLNAGEIPDNRLVHKPDKTILVNGKVAAYIQNETGKVPYTTLSEALDAVKSGETILVAAGSYDEVLVIRDLLAESVTIKADGDVTLTGGITGSGEMDNLTIEGIRFTGSPISGTWNSSRSSITTLTLKNCVFDGVQAPGNKLGAVNLSGSGNYKNLEVSGCTFKDVVDITDASKNDIQSVGIYAQDYDNVTVTGCTFSGISGTPLNLNGNKGTMVVRENTFNGWGTSECQEGRAVRISAKSGSLSFTGNKLVCEPVSKESFVKITGLKVAQMDVTRNYWSGHNPDADTSEDGSPLAEFDADVKVEVYPYYADVALTQLVYRNNPVADAVDAAIEAANKALAASGIAALSGKTLATLTAEDLANADNAAALRAIKEQFGTIMTNLNAAVSVEVLDAYLTEHPEEKRQIGMLYDVYTVAFTIIPMPQAPQAEVRPDEVPVPQVPEGVTPPTDQEVEAAVEKAVTEIVNNDAVSNSIPEGLKEAVTGSLGQQSNIGVYIQPVLLDVTLGAEISGEGEQATVELVPMELVFEVSPMIQQLDENKDPIPGTEDQISNNDLNGRKVTFRLPIPNSIKTTQVKITHVFSDGSGSETMVLEVKGDAENGKYIEVSVTRFSKFILTPYTPSKPSTGNGSSSSSDSTVGALDAEKFWNNVISRINRADDGEIIKVNASRMENVPSRVLKALVDKDVTLVISYKGNETILNGLTMKDPAGNRIYYTFADLEKLYAESTVDVETGKTAVGDKYIPITGGGYMPGVTQATVIFDAAPAEYAQDAAALPELPSVKAVPEAQPNTMPVQPEDSHGNAPVLPFILGGIALATLAVIIILVYKKREI